MFSSESHATGFEYFQPVIPDVCILAARTIDGGRLARDDWRRKMNIRAHV
jgi:hypothetical protein